MKLLKKINNNFALGLDSSGTTIIVEGRGVGFQKMPCELDDLSIVSKTYYNTREQDISLIKSIPEEVLETASKIADKAMLSISGELNSNLAFILADHIQFSIERFQKGMNVELPIYYDIEHLYRKESEIAEYALELIRTELNVDLPDSEKTGIAMNIINSENKDNGRSEDMNRIIALCTSIVENQMKIKINRKSFNYSRFVSHIQYVIQKQTENYMTLSNNADLYQSVSQTYPNVKECVDRISEELRRRGYRLNEEEKLYLMLHVNRLCDRQGL